MSTKAKPMSARMLRALKSSIRRWEKIAAQPTPKMAEDYYFNTTCALCDAYMHNNGSCASCPIKARTGLDLCCGTPYPSVIESLFAREYVTAEVRFLKSLLPKGERS